MSANETDPKSNGRNGKGRFVKGNAGGPGNPYNKALKTFRTAWFKQCREEHITEAYRWLYEAWSKDEKGFPPAVRLQAFREFMDRTVGKVKETVEIESSIDADEVRAGVLEFIRTGNRN